MAGRSVDQESGGYSRIGASKGPIMAEPDEFGALFPERRRFRLVVRLFGRANLEMGDRAV
jgi:hypothetical protein